MIISWKCPPQSIKRKALGSFELHYPLNVKSSRSGTRSGRSQITVLKSQVHPVTTVHTAHDRRATTRESRDSQRSDLPPYIYDKALKTHSATPRHGYTYARTTTSLDARLRHETRSSRASMVLHASIVGIVDDLQRSHRARHLLGELWPVPGPTGPVHLPLL